MKVVKPEIDKNWVTVETSVNNMNKIAQWLAKNLTSHYLIYLHHVSFEDPKEATYFQLAFKRK